MKEFLAILRSFAEIVLIVLAVVGVIALITLGFTYAPLLTLFLIFGIVALVIWLGTYLG
ncbi:hypothetical protein [Aestuariivirga sp.]|uniref:hypothetical protein n=1 Tax=Aestuariivirga sp. TaxID=2650926 RepID=UPI0039E5BB60